MAFNRRVVLRGLFQGSALAVVALPFLDCFLDGNGEALAATGERIPTRFGTYLWGCGLQPTLSIPKEVGVNYETRPQLVPLDPFKKKFNLFSGLKVDLGDNPNYQHWTGVGSIATGIAPSQNEQFDSQTIDQTVADVIGRTTRFKSIEVSLCGDKKISYSSLGGANVLPGDVSPLALYTRLFGPGFQDPSKGEWKPDPQVMLQQSVLSVVADDRKRLMQNVGTSDRARLDQYFTSVRESEQQVAAELQRPQIVAKVTIPDAPGEMEVDRSIPHLRVTVPIFARLMALGLATDQTRVFNMALAETASNIYEPGNSRPFHQGTHEEPVDAALGYQPITARFSVYSMEFFADLLKELDGVQEGSGTLLDHSLVFAYTDSSWAKIHALDGIPMMLAGGANGRMKTGYHIAGGDTVVSRVGLTVQQVMGMPVSTWGKDALQTNQAFTEVLV